MVMKSPDHPLRSPLVVKLGGSLHQHVPELAAALRASKRALVVIPGGGKYADAVRNANITGDSAHWMAVAAMDQYGWDINSHGIGVTTLLHIPARPVVFLPYCSLRQYDPLPHSWNVTSDSIAAWAAAALGLDLLLLKSVDGILENGRLADRINTQAETDIVDPYFIPYVLKMKVMTTIINGSSPGRVEKFLKGDTIPGTRIGTTF